MENEQFMQVAQEWANQILVWVGFGTIVGLLAKFRNTRPIGKICLHNYLVRVRALSDRG